MGSRIQDLKERLKERNKDPKELCNLGTEIPVFLNFGIDQETNLSEGSKKEVTQAIIHEGLKSDELPDRIEDYVDEYE